MTEMIQRPYKCDIDITFPSNKHAMDAKNVLSVDQEIGDKAEKTFEILQNSTDETKNNILRV